MTKGTVVKGPTATSAQPALFHSSWVSLFAINNPKPAPRATRVPAINMSSGMLKVLSLIKTLLEFWCDRGAADFKRTSKQGGEHERTGRSYSEHNAILYRKSD